MRRDDGDHEWIATRVGQQGCPELRVVPEPPERLPPPGTMLRFEPVTKVAGECIQDHECDPMPHPQPPLPHIVYQRCDKIRTGHVGTCHDRITAQLVEQVDRVALVRILHP